MGSGYSVLRRIRQSPRLIAGAHIPGMMPGPHQLANIVPTYRVTFKMSPRTSFYVIITQIRYVNLIARMTKDKKKTKAKTQKRQPAKHVNKVYSVKKA